ncbi:flagella synthesis protein FlgN [Pandoraea commovens]|uniref:Flagella synthesis protein FlgN n=1 Tax=Pandoraea commovens TaxID=2508289 RepID=A0A5E4TI83_9BURK|nr:flagellar protein FlgN [Pandoraea commovens]UVA79459.1 flagellar protein FlgN [Pandoraea commovens]VVD87716.1 Flagella synthesis protein FlgN [Pandoraea commovens]
MTTDALLNALTAETAAIGTFSTLLGEEQQALVNGTLDALPDLTERKTRAVAELSALGRERDAQLKALGYSPDEAGATAAAAADPKVDTAWKALLAAAAEAKRANDTNGLLINTRLTYTQQALNVLYGPGNNTPLYGPDGRTTPRSSGGSVTA